MARKVEKEKKVKKAKVAAPKPRKLVAKKSKPTAPKKKIPVKTKLPKEKKLVEKHDDLLTAEMGPEEIVSEVSEGQNNRKIEESKFDIGVPHNAHAVPSQEIPFEYGKDKAVLLIVDPRFVFTYWEIEHNTLREATSRIKGHAKLTLRFYDITSGSAPEQSHSWDVEVFDRIGNWYLKLDRPEQRLCIDVGVKGPSGDFITLARSNVMRLPPTTLAKPGPIKWMVVTPAGDKLLSDIEDYTDADLELLKKILGPYFYDLLTRGRFASIAGSSIEAIFYDVNALQVGESPTSGPPWSAQ